jgi:hypothetical protein
MLSSLPTAIAKKALVKEMWESGAYVMVRGSITDPLAASKPYSIDSY